MFKLKNALLISSAIWFAGAAPALAQNSNTGDTVDVTTTNDTVDVTTDDMNGVTTATDSHDGDDDTGKWGLLGLLGLAGLLGMKRREPDHTRDTTSGTNTDRR